MDDLDWTLLTLLDRERSISAIAQELFITQPALTYRVKKMESYFQARLFTRTKKGFLPTPVGELAIEYAKSMKKELKKVQEDIFSLEGKVKGKIYIGSSSAVAQYLLPDLLSKFNDLYPDIELNVVTGFSSSLVPLLYDGKIHVAFLREEIEWNHYKQLLSTEGIFLVSRSPIELEKLPSLSRLDYTTNPSLRGLLDGWWAQNFRVPPKVTMNVDTADTCKEMVRAGLGYTFLTELCLRSEQELCCVPLLNSAGVPLSRQTWLYGTEEAVNFIAVREFLAFISGVLG
ncbi:LysR family transcriptional regulator [Ammoniphilus resinae]|uniref:DNA-binding transcriptional LysR family regulator n=1 Tax=Ammoniphilus resinae TaxID=861532 RepID=A0ABS4GPH6_9BACL|nr:LysR family transcriptional regulator [Ammoniphilus resinae]MBP1932178.1 DNA-binding transcriptional LysR family regulator [Ammoniphilus resinae]